jgi:hypothetical protein
MTESEGADANQDCMKEKAYDSEGNKQGEN